jgi:pyruvate/2-oxoglutarate dehydrogenase complex dihydrolipoamide acyltransferase (E2) component
MAVGAHTRWWRTRTAHQHDDDPQAADNDRPSGITTIRTEGEPGPMSTNLHAIRMLFATMLAGLLLAIGLGRLSDAQSPVKTGGATATPSTPAPQPPKAAANDDDGDGDSDLEKKVAIMNSPRWRRAIFELGEWLSAQAIYTPAQVRNIKADFNRKVETMSPHDLEYLLDDLDEKFQILDTPEAKDARSWVAQYLSVMSDQKRAEALKDVPNVVTMTAGQLQLEIQKIEQKRGTLQQQQAAFDEGRQQLVQQAQAARQQTAAASAAATSRTGGVSYSPYRSGGGGGGGKPPFSDVQGSGMSITSGPFGAYVSMNLGGF